MFGLQIEQLDLPEGLPTIRLVGVTGPIEVHIVTAEERAEQERFKNLRTALDRNSDELTREIQGENNR
ncbi:hypothetical protein ABKN59_011291 [Abortiporus biennis]